MAKKAMFFMLRKEGQIFFMPNKKSEKISCAGKSTDIFPLQVVRLGIYSLKEALRLRLQGTGIQQFCMTMHSGFLEA